MFICMSLRMIKKRYKHPAIALCRQCGGKGIVDDFPKEDIFRQMDSFRDVCPLCKGSGRVIVSAEVLITIVAYTPEEV